MPFVETRLISPTTLTTSASSALYTVPTGYSAIIKQLVVTNITGTAATFTFYIGTVSASNAIFSGTSVAANDTVIVNLSQVLTTGETLRALASTGSALNLTVSGVINDGPLASTATYIADNAITSAKIADGAIVNADINASAAIAVSKLANATAGQVLIGTTTTGVITPTTISGDVTVTGAGVTAIKSDVSLTGTPLAPTATAGTNTTQLATTAFANTAGGLVYITSAALTTGSSVSIANCFSSTYDNYRVVASFTRSAGSGSAYCFFRLGGSGTDHVMSGQYMTWNSGTRNGDNGGDGYATFTGLGQNSVISDIMSPNLATYTFLNNYGNSQDYQTISSNRVANTTQYTGFTFLVGTGAFTAGTITVYGYRK
jgi:hypothetical protein